MFDVTTARQIDYTDPEGNDLQVTVFRDRTDESVWYMVPVPRLRIDKGGETFSLTKYVSNGGGIAGTCVFEVELFAPSEAKQAAERQIPEIKSWGQFTWTSGTVVFDYELPVDGKPEAQQAIVTPSLFGTNTARFQIELEAEDQLNTFIEAFRGNGVSNFSVEYQMGVLTQLLGAKATIKFTASVAIDYERKYETKKDTWGKKHKVLVSVKQNLKSSGAGEVDVEKGKGGTNELVQMVRDWAWSALENQVADAIETAQQMAEGNENPLSVVSDINATYKEDAIVEWNTPVSRFLPRFSEEAWSKHYHEVDNRQLVVTFDLAGDPSLGETGRKPPIRDVEVTVRYPTRTTDNTFKLSYGEGGKTSVTYVAPGAGNFDPEYEYKYKVNFPDATSYTSGWLKESDTRVTFRPNRFGIRKVAFIGSDLPFEGDSEFALDKVYIDFFEKPPEGQKPKLQTKELNAEEGKIEFSSTYHVPITNRYNYRLRYVLKSGDIITVQPGEEFGSDNADQVFVLSPEQYMTSFDIRAITTTDGGGFLFISANATYYDDKNPSTSVPQNHNWDDWQPEAGKGLSSAPTWSFAARPDPQTAFFQINGQVVYSDGDLFPLTDLNVPYVRRTLLLKDTEEVYSLKIYTDSIDWDEVDEVTINVFQLRDLDGNVLAEPGDIPEAYRRAIAARYMNAEEEDKQVHNLVPYSILPPSEDGQPKSLPLYYTLYKPRGASNIVFYFNADYVMSDGTVRGIEQTEVTNKLQLHLPPAPDKEPGEIHTGIVKLGED